MTTAKTAPKPARPVPGPIWAEILPEHKEWAHLAEPWQDPADLVIVTPEMVDRLYACDGDGVTASDGAAFMTEGECQQLVDAWTADWVVSPATRFQWAASRLAPPVVRTGGPMSHPRVDSHGLPIDANDLLSPAWGPVGVIPQMPDNGVPDTQRRPLPTDGDYVQRAANDKLREWGAANPAALDDDTGVMTRQFDAVIP